MPQDSIRSIAQTADGFLWIGTNEGLSRFDGYDFTTFTKDDGYLPSNSVSIVAAGRDGSLWIGTPEGLALYHNGHFTTFTLKDGLPNNRISALLEDSNGALWIVAGSFISRFEHGRFINYAPDRLASVRVPRSIFEDAQETLWVSGAGGVAQLVNGDFAPVLGEREMKGQSGSTITGDRNGGLWIGGSNGIIFRARDGALKRFDSRDGLPDNLVVSLWVDRDGNLWAGTNRGLSRLEGDRFTASDFEGGGNHDFVRCLFEDQEGDLWAGMRSGLNRLRDDVFTVFGRAEGFPRDAPVAVHQDRGGTIWVAYNGSGLLALRNGKTQVYTKKDGLPSDEIYAIRETRNGDLLIPSRGGLSRLHAGHFSNYDLGVPLSLTVTLDVLEDRQGRIWAAGQGGVYEIEGEHVRIVIPADPLLNGPAVVLAEGQDGAVWVGTDGGGLRKIWKGEITSLRVSNGLGSDAIRCLYQDPDGTLWIGSLGGGLEAFRSGTVTRYTVKDGLLSNNISHIEDDGHGFLWLSTHRGISRVSKQQLRDFSAGRAHSIVAVNYGVDDGLPSSQVAPGYPTGGGGTQTADGRLWFPTTKGLAVIDPKVENAQPLPAPNLEFLEVNVDGKSLDVAQAAKIKPGLRHIQFRYSAVHLNNPEIVRYEYKLEGFDADWIPAGSSRVVNYTNLRHGPYRFAVRAVVPGHVPSQGAFDMEVLPHFYENANYILLFVASLIGAIYGLYQLRLRQLRLRFALVLDERARMAREIHDTLSQGFVGISSQLNAVAVRIRVNDGIAEQHLELARKMARHSLTEARRSLMDLRVSLLDDLDLTSALQAAAQQWTAGSDIRLDVQVAGERRQFPHDVEQNLLRIAQEAVTNSRKHSGAANIWIRMQTDQRKVLLTVRDDGRGFDSRAVSIGDGHFGLLGMGERAERLGGQFEIFSQPEKGTEIRATIPLVPEHARGFPKGGLLGVLWKRLTQAHS